MTKFIKLKRIPLYALSLACSGCLHMAPQKNLIFLHEVTLPPSLAEKSLPLGGLSALSFDEKTHSLFALSDDKKKHRVYRFELKKDHQLLLKESIFLKEGGSQKMNRNMDPEGLVFYEGEFFIASEGQQIFTPPEPPQIFRFSKNMELKEAWETPPVFWNLKQIKSYGTQENKGFESLTLNPRKKILWTATEKPLRQDLPISKKMIRLSAFKLESKKLLYQLPYLLSDPQAGLTETLFLKPKIFLTLERTSQNKKITRIHLYLTNCQKALPIKIHQFSSPCQKKLLLDWSQFPSVSLDNLEGMTLGPRLSAGRRLLLFVGDNDFIPNKKTKILFFSFKIPSFF